jgi:transmembrane sensor
MKMTKKHFEALLDKYLHGSASPDEIKLLDQFFDSYREHNGDVRTVSEEIKAEIFHSIQSSVCEPKKIFAKPAISVLLRVAAIISFFVVASYFLYGRFERNLEPATQPLAVKLKELRTLKGQKLEVKLSDGSRIRLNTNTKISYPEKFANEKREVILEGEAYFEIAHDSIRPFIVHTAHATTRVLGTSFNVLSGPQATAITLVEGKVNVSLPNGQEATLTPNLQATIVREAKQIETHEVDVSKFVGWKDNTLYFNNNTVREAFTIIENWYNVDIDVKDEQLLNCVITSKYQNESLENVLNSFRFILKMDFTINGQQVIVSGKGCSKE